MLNMARIIACVSPKLTALVVASVPPENPWKFPQYTAITNLQVESVAVISNPLFKLNVFIEHNTTATAINDQL